MLQSEFIRSVIPQDAKVIIAMPSTSIANSPAFYTVAPNLVNMLITDDSIAPEWWSRSKRAASRWKSPKRLPAS